MPDTFDPDAWPHGGNSGPANGRTSTPQDEPAAANDDWGMGQPALPTADGYGDDDFGNYDDFGDYGDFEDDPEPQGPAAGAAPPLTATRRGARQQPDDDDFFGADDDDDPYDQRYDQDDEFDNFDREPSGSSNKRRLLIVGAIAFLLLAVVFFGVRMLGGSDETPVGPPPAQNAAPGAAPAPNAQPSAAAPPAEVIQALNSAMEGWGRFAVNGNLDEVRPYFVPEGDQFNQFQIESADIKARPIGGEPFQMRMPNPTAFSVNGEWVLRGTVLVDRPGEQQQQFPWEIRFTRQSERDPWQILTVQQF